MYAARPVGYLPLHRRVCADVIAGSYSRGPRDRDGDLTPNDRLGRIGWFENLGDKGNAWKQHDISRRKRGMFDAFVRLAALNTGG